MSDIDYHFITPLAGYHYNADGIKMIAKHYRGAIFMGSWAVPIKSGGWSEIPIDVFYQPNPDRSKGHSNYFGIFQRPINGDVVITNAEGAFSVPLTGIVAKNGEVVISRWRHDYRMSSDQSVWIDGGRDYVKCSGGKLVEVMVKDDKFMVCGDDNSLLPVNIKLISEQIQA
jgi:hypothetical protein